MTFPELQELNTPRLTLRKLTLADAPLYFQRIASRPEVAQYMLWEPHRSLAETENMIQTVLDRYKSGFCYRWCIALAEDNSPIGAIDLLRFNKAEQTCSFAYMLGSDFWGRGYGTEVLRTVLEFAFEKIQMSTVTADHMAANPASGAVMRKAGMSFCRIVPRKYEKNGQKMDAWDYSITQDQWKYQNQCL